MRPLRIVTHEQHLFYVRMETWFHIDVYAWLQEFGSGRGEWVKLRRVQNGWEADDTILEWLAYVGAISEVGRFVRAYHSDWTFNFNRFGQRWVEFAAHPGRWRLS